MIEPPKLLLALVVTVGLVAVKPVLATPPPEGGEEGRLVVLTSLALGSRDGTEPISAVVVSASDELRPLLDAWGARADEPDLKKVFALHKLREVGRWARALPATGGVVEAEVIYGGVPYRYELRVGAPVGDQVMVSVEVRRKGEIVAAPKVLTRLGERASVATGTEDGAILYLALEPRLLPSARP